MNKVVDLIETRVVRSLRKVLPSTRSIDGGSQLERDLGLDSLAMMELVLALEDRFDVSIPLEQVARVATVDDLIDTLKSSLLRACEKSCA